MTPAERLRDIWRRLGNAEDWSDLHRPLDDLTALANEVEGKVLVKPDVNSNGPYPVVAYVVDTKITGSGATADEAIIDLQRKWDGLGG